MESLRCYVGPGNQKKQKKNQPQEVLFIVRKTCFVTLNY